MADDAERNWYKISTIALSAAMVVLTFMSVVYYRGLDDRRQRATRLDVKIREFQEALNAANHLPRIRVVLKTLKESGLPAASFRGMSSVPSVIEISHIGGDSANGVSVRVTSDMSLLRVLPDVSIDHFTYVIAADKRSVTFDMPLLRKTELIRATLMHGGLARLTTAARINHGYLVPDAPDHLPFTGVYPLRIPPTDLSTWKTAFYPLFGLTEEKALDLRPDSATDPKVLEAQVEILQRLRREIEKSPVLGFDWSKSVFSRLFVPILSSVALALVFTWALHYLNYRMHLRILIARQGHHLKNGQSKAEVETVVGRWDRKKLLVAGPSSSQEVWWYQPVWRPFSRKVAPGVLIWFANDVVSNIQYADYH